MFCFAYEVMMMLSVADWLLLKSPSSCLSCSYSFLLLLQQLLLSLLSLLLLLLLLTFQLLLLLLLL